MTASTDGRNVPAADQLLAGLRVRGPMTCLTVVQALVGEAMGLLDDDRHPNGKAEVRRRLQLAFDLCVGQRSAPYRARRGRRDRPPE